MTLSAAYIIAMLPALKGIFALYASISLIASIAACIILFFDFGEIKKYARIILLISVIVHLIFVPLCVMTPSEKQLNAMMLNYHGEYIQCDVQGKCQEEK